MIIEKNIIGWSDLEIASHQMSYAFKMESYIKRNFLNLEDFDVRLEIVNDNQSIILQEEEFTALSLQSAAQVSISISISAFFITLWNAIELKGKFNSKKIPVELVTEDDLLIGLIYSIRNCFAHSPGFPRWHFTNLKFQTLYTIKDKIIDLRNKQGQMFDYKDIGGHDTIWILKNLVSERNLI